MRIFKLISFLLLLTIGYKNLAFAASANNAKQEFQNYFNQTLQNNEIENSKKESAHPLDQIFSDKSFEIKSGLKKIIKTLPEMVLNKSFKAKHTNRILSLLSHKSKAIRNLTLELLRSHGGTLFRNNFLSREVIIRYAENAYASSEDVIAFLALLDALLPYEANYPFMLNEYSFLILEGLMATRYEAAEITKDILKNYSHLLIEKKYLLDKHIDKFLLIARDIPEDNKILYINVLENVLPNLVKNKLINKKGFLNTMSLLHDSKPDVREKYIKLLTNRQLQSYLYELDVFNQEWTEKLIKDIIGTDYKQKQISLDVLSALFIPFYKAEAITKKDFDKVWGHISENLDSFEDPFVLILDNITSLSAQGWFTKKDFGKLYVDLDQKSPLEQELIFEFINENYKTFSAKRWINNKPLVQAIFYSDYQDDRIKMLKLETLSNHPQMLRNFTIFDKDELSLFLDNLDSDNTKTFNLTLDIIQKNYSYWARNGTLNAENLDKLIDREPSHAKTAKILKLIDNLYASLPKLFDKGTILSLSNMGFSPNYRVRKTIKNFFIKHYNTLKTEKKISTKIIKLLKEADIYDYIEDAKPKRKLRYKSRFIRS